MKRLLVPAILLSMKKVAFTILCCAVLMFIAAPAWADQCSGKFPDDNGTCGVLITIMGTPGNLSAAITGGGVGSSYDGSEDELVGIQNNSSVKVGAIILSAPPTEGSNLFAFDTDGVCDFFPLAQCGPTANVPTGYVLTRYEGPRNIFVGISSDKTTGKVLFVNPLAAGGTTWFSLEGTPTKVVAIGENQTLTGGVTAIYRFGPGNPTANPAHPAGSEDDFKITPQITASDDPTGDIMTVTPVPVPASAFSATNFSNLTCIPYFDYSSTPSGGDNNPITPVCIELEMDCSGADGCNFQYTTQLDYGLYGPGLLNGSTTLIGGPHLLVQHDVPCPATAFTDDILLSYTGATAGAPTQPDPPPVRGGSSPAKTCIVSAYDTRPSVPLIAQGVTVSIFDGFEDLSKTKPNKIDPGIPEFLIFDVRDSSGNPVTNLTLCADTSCSVPFVNLSSFAIADCPAGFPPAGSLPSFGGLLPGDEAGEYVFIWDTRTTVNVKKCQVGVTVHLGTGAHGTGPSLTGATFQYKK